MSDAERTRFTCPCCGHLVFDEAPGSDDICPVCFWQDDVVQLRWPDIGGGANRPSLIEAQGNVVRLGAVEERLVPFVRSATSTEPLDEEWRPFDVHADAVKEHIPGVDYGMTYATDGTTYYYWRHPGP